ncbi:MAG TPA: cache domain-containing protein, partial [Gallionella sp.]|nr:cache domain-containing protein [Gallionella sp.]
MKISVRLLLFFLAVAALPLMLFSYLNLRQDEETLRTEAFGRMSDLADKKAVQVRSYLAERVQDVRLLARGPRVMTAMAVLPGEYLPARRAGAAYAAEDANTHQYFERYVEETGLFYDVFFISVQGEIVYTQKHETDFGSNLLTGSLRDSKFAQAFRAVRMTMEPVISGYEIYEPSHAPALFIAAPVIVGGKLKGVFAVQLGNELLYRVANDATGLGITGEVTFAQHDGDGVLYTTPMKYRADAAMKYRVQGAELKSLPTSSATSGNSGAGSGPDYRGIPVIAAWRYLPELEWGMVVKVDVDEVLEPIARQRMLLIEALAVCLLLAALTAYYLGRRISRPIRALAQVADQVSAGRLDSRADENAPGELGVFAAAFNRMTVNLQELYRTLEDRIDERTRELNATNEQ